MTWFPVNINFNVSPVVCPQVNMPAKRPDGTHEFEGIEFKSNKATCKFTGISIVDDIANQTEWPTPTFSSDNSSMFQKDLYLDSWEKNHSFTIYYTDNGVAKSIDPGIQNED